MIPSPSPLRSILAAVTLAGMAAFVVSGCGDAPVGGEPDGGGALDEPVADRIPGVVEPDSTRPRITIRTPVGHIEVELRPDLAPRHVAQFLDLVDEEFYDGLTFHRVIPGFLIQGGDPNSRNDDPADDGYGGLEERRLPVEVSDHNFTRGTVGMARDYRWDGASTQFFILLSRAAHLDERYTVLGRVTRGIDVADRLAAEPRDLRDHPEDPVAFTITRMARP